MMGIYIKGMEMPTDGCKNCIFVNRKWYGDVCLILKREVTGNVERGGFQTDCPLVPVSPHGRLIDADALLSLDRQIYDGEIAVGRREYIFCFEVEDAPTVIEAEEDE